jgi:hypothetical protein
VAVNGGVYRPDEEQAVPSMVQDFVDRLADKEQAVPSMVQDSVHNLEGEEAVPRKVQEFADDYTVEEEVMGDCTVEEVMLEVV